MRELRIEKIVVIGAPGAGKTTLAKKMHSTLGIKVIHLDRIFWKRGWQALPRDKRIDILQKIVTERQWIIEGSYLDLSEPRLEAADTIIFLDTPILICLKRMIWRHHESHGRFRRDIPLGCTDKLTLYRIFRVLTFPFREGRWLEKKLRDFPPQKVILLKEAKEVNDFLAQPALFIYRKRQAAKASSTSEERHNIFYSPFSLLTQGLKSIRIH